ncbi:protein O-mannose kinase-like [Octopus vulgaris]|uniref:Protein O-mannose kinase n=1 Tax=Octopus vulgaris TaxID=6645 RepID=A0AA36BDY6_OCTVU|nr:protein O-mannose kinase-like [Octopus vulgaris]
MLPAVKHGLYVLLLLFAQEGVNPGHTALPEPPSLLCYQDMLLNKQVCRPACLTGYFAVAGMNSCHQWLTCEDFDTNITIGRKIASGLGKMVYEAHWQNQTFVMNKATKDNKYWSDFHHGLTMITAFQPHPHIIQLVGHCNKRYLTEFHPLMSADHLFDHLKSKEHTLHDTIELRYQLCMDYVNILAYLHSSPRGTRVMCDSNDLTKTLSQFLLRSDLRLILNDLDALPEVNRSKNQFIKCGHREIGGEFVAPEQLWPYLERPFVDADMPSYDEKSDIWKIPSVCSYVLGSSSDAVLLKLHLLHIHSRCQYEEPELRPTAKEVAEEYERIWKVFTSRKGQRSEL